MSGSTLLDDNILRMTSVFKLKSRTRRIWKRPTEPYNEMTIKFRLHPFCDDNSDNNNNNNNNSISTTLSSTPSDYTFNNTNKKRKAIPYSIEECQFEWNWKCPSSASTLDSGDDSIIPKQKRIHKNTLKTTTPTTTTPSTNMKKSEEATLESNLLGSLSLAVADEDNIVQILASKFLDFRPPLKD